jgi:hypothetical protein
MKTTIVFLMMSALGVAGCYRDNEEELYGCRFNAASITYSGTIANILAGNSCTGCHSGIAPAGGFNLTTYNGVKSSVSAGRLYGAINHMAGFSPMPQGGGKMTDCDISRVKAWIDAGAPNN